MRRNRGNVNQGRFAGRGRVRDRTGFHGLGGQSTPLAQRRTGRRSTWLRFLPLWGGAVLMGAAVGAGFLGSPWQGQPLALASDQPTSRVHFSLCHTGGGQNCVVDGDTIWFGGQKIRVADIDAPETHEPRCESERALGDRATLRLQQLVNGGQVSLQSIDRDEDRYGRKLRIVLVDGDSVGDTLVSEGLARWYAGGRRPWC